MSARKTKRRVMDLFHRRLYSIFFWRSAEDLAWLNAVPVGREFGSRDYDRLSLLDMYSWGNISEEEAMHQLGVDSSGLAAMLARDELSPLLMQDAWRTKAEAGTKAQDKVCDVKDLKGMFGKTSKTVSIDDMNPFKHKP